MKALFGIFALVVLIVTTAVPRPTHADDYPNKPIRVISDSAPGSAVDVTFRLVMDRLGAKLGQQIAPVAQPGAALARLLLGVLLGIRILARSKPERALLEGVARPALALLD
jgi:hypothetical protein